MTRHRESFTRVPSIAAQQGGAFTRAQAVSEGWTPRQVSRRISEGAWVRLVGTALVSGTALASGTALTTDGALASGGALTSEAALTTGTADPDDVLTLGWAAQLTWPGSVISHRWAAVAHGIPSDFAHPPAHLQVIAARRRRRAFRMQNHDVPLSADEIVPWQGLSITSVQRTITDCLLTMPPEHGLQFWDWVSVMGLMTAPELREAEYRRSGRPGVATLRWFSDAASKASRICPPSAQQPGSQNGSQRQSGCTMAQLMALRLLRQAHLGGWHVGTYVRLPNGEALPGDIVFFRHKVIVDVDGYGRRHMRGPFATLAERHAAAATAGFVILQFSWDDLTNHPQAMTSAIRKAVRRNLVDPLSCGPDPLRPCPSEALPF